MSVRFSCSVLITLLVLCLIVPSTARAAFVLSVAPASLSFNGPGAHNIDFTIAHNGVGLSSLSGYTVRLGDVANASLGVAPTGVLFTGATEVLPVSQAGPTFVFNPAVNQISAANTGFGPFADIGNGGSAVLFSVQAILGNELRYDIGVDFRNAQRGGLFATDISSEFFNPNSPTTDFSFTLNNSAAAIPEPSSIVLLGLASCGALVRFRKRMSQKALAA